MKIITKPLTVKHRPDTPAVAAVVAATTAPRTKTARRAYDQLVTGQNVHPERAKSLLRMV